jgi:hypothetical protein
MRAAIALLAALLLSCGSTPAPRRMCLRDSQRYVRPGQVVATREDGATLFRFEDQGEGDHGYMWVGGDGGDTRYRVVPCTQPTLGSAEESARLE